ncbi:MAG: Ig-like domain-containing protein, partial [Bacteroidaceae bacterium]|nr:Ig-like domain-containing protein [Bacteroidaceae bacterium]
MKTRHTIPILATLLAALLVACASIGNPDGGAYDETPPRVLSASPADRSVMNRRKKVNIYFDEFIKLQNANEKVVVSPPQIEAANVRADGKRIKIDLFDSLQANTTYTIDFSDAIEDNNEGNPMGQYTYSFSTGETIDTMEISGYVLNAADLEPVKGIMVGLYPADSTFHDSIFRTKPFSRVSRTNGSGRFCIKGVKPGKYKAYALTDADGNFIFNQKSEQIAFDTLT